MKPNARRLALLPLILAGCDDALDVDIERLDPIPQVDELDFSQVRPAGSPEYWELRFAWGGARAIGSGREFVARNLEPTRGYALVSF